MKTEQKLEKALMKLEELSQKIVETKGYTSESNRLKLLSEFIKEQLRNEDPNYSTRKTR